MLIKETCETRTASVIAHISIKQILRSALFDASCRGEITDARFIW